MKKKLIILAVLAALIITGCILSGVWNTAPLYEIMEEDGNHYMVMHLDWFGQLSPDSFSEESPRWKSAKKAKESIISGRLSLDELLTLMWDSNGWATGRLEIIDPDLICDLKLPKGLSVDEVIWRGDSYTISFSGEIGSGRMHIRLQNPSEEAFLLSRKGEHEREYPRSDDRYNLIGETFSQEHTAMESIYQIDRNYISGYTKYKFLEYSVNHGGNRIFVQEKYILEANESGRLSQVNEEIPSVIQIYGTSNGIQFTASISPKVRPTMEQLCAFTLVRIES